MKSAPEHMDGRNKGQTTVFYDGACPMCVKDMHAYERLAGSKGSGIRWVDITGQETYLRDLGIDPHKALRELHVQKEDQRIVSEIDAYVLLMQKVTLLKPLAGLIGHPLMRPLFSKWYHWSVDRRLKRSGRL